MSGQFAAIHSFAYLIMAKMHLTGVAISSYPVAKIVSIIKAILTRPRHDLALARQIRAISLSGQIRHEPYALTL